MKDSILLRFLYGTVPGRMALRLLVQPEVSKAAGRFLSSRASWWLAPYYIHKYGIDMSGIEIPKGGFPSFNAFFTRRRKGGFRQESDGTDTAGTGADSAERTGLCGGSDISLLSPCDGFLTPIRIRGNTVFDIKHTRFSLEDLLGDTELAGRFRDGLALVFRLTPANYHRYCYAADGTVLRHRRISGKLHCVRPVALREIPVFVQNSREYQVVRTEAFGTMVQMEIGALLVGKICSERLTRETNHVRAGVEKGYFEFGGSTILLLLEKDAVCIRRELYARRNADGEISVRAGEKLTKD